MSSKPPLEQALPSSLRTELQYNQNQGEVTAAATNQQHLPLHMNLM